MHVLMQQRMRRPTRPCLQAGGGVFFDSAAGQSSMRFVDSGVDNNMVTYSLAGNSHDGLGGECTRQRSNCILHTSLHRASRGRCAACAGGVFLNHYNFDLDNLTLSGNAAYYGAGLYVSTDVTSNATLSGLALSNNVGMLGAPHAR